MYSRGRLGALAVMPLLLVALAGPGVAGATAATRVARRSLTTAPPRPAPGWVLSRVRFEPLTPGSIVGVDGLGDYRGAIEVGPSPSGGVSVVNDVGLEDYVRGIAEVPSTWPVEALKAQAIAARTYALHQLVSVPESYKAAGYQICASDSCQVYAGLAKERAPSGAQWVAAVDATAGRAVLYQGLPILAKYSASNGGRSVAGGQPYLRAVDDPDDARLAWHQWHVVLDAAQVQSLFAIAAPVVGAGRSGDSVVLSWQADDGSTGQVSVPAGDFRSKVDGAVPPQDGMPQTIPSTLFDVGFDSTARAVTVDGRGFGHGIGLSQYGALGKASRGLKADDILAAYYAGLRSTPFPSPSSIRVGLDPARAAASVVGSAQFRVIDGSGQPLAVAASGRWQVTPAPGGVRVIPAPGQDAMAAVDHTALDPGRVQAGASPKIRFRVGPTPALVTVKLASPSGLPPVALEPVLVQPGDAERQLPVVRDPGTYTVTVSADAGGGRVATVPLALVVTPAPRGQDAPRASTAVVVPDGGPSLPGLRLAFGVVAVIGLVIAGSAAGRAWTAERQVH